MDDARDPISAMSDDQPTSEVESSPGSDHATLRRACDLCFWVMSPDDPDPQLRTFVQVDTKRYHSQCWTRYIQPQDPSRQAQPISIAAPPPLAGYDRVPALLNARRVALSDKPLGLSTGTVVLDGADRLEPLVLTLRNNSDQAIEVPRDFAPAWAFLDFSTYGRPTESSTLTLAPGEERSATVYSHIARPDTTRQTMTLTHTAEVQFQATNTLWPLVVAGGALSGGLFLTVMTAFSWTTDYFNVQRGTPRLDLLFAVLVMLCIAFSACYFLLPARMLWGLSDLLGRIGRIRFLQTVDLVQTLVRRLQAAILVQFDTGRVVTWYQKPSRLIVAALLAGLVTSLIALPVVLLGIVVVRFVVSLFGVLGQLAVLVGLGALAYFLAARILSEYQIDLIGQTQRVISYASVQGRHWFRVIQKSINSSSTKR